MYWVSFALYASLVQIFCPDIGKCNNESLIPIGMQVDNIAEVTCISFVIPKGTCVFKFPLKGDAINIALTKLRYFSTIPSRKLYFTVAPNNDADILGKSVMWKFFEEKQWFGPLPRFFEKNPPSIDHFYFGWSATSVFKTEINFILKTTRTDVNIGLAHGDVYERSFNRLSEFIKPLSGNERSPNEENANKSKQSDPNSDNEHAKSPKRHILLSLQVIIGLILCVLSAYALGETSKPVDKAAFRHDGPAGWDAFLASVGIVQGGALAFIGLILLVG